MPGKYAAQQKYMKNTLAQFQIRLKPDILDAFKAKCRENGTTPTTEIKKFINAYIEDTAPFRPILPRD